RQRHQAEKKLPTCISWSYLRQNPHKGRLHSNRKLDPKVRRLDANVAVVEGPSANLNHLRINTLGPRTVWKEVDSERFHHSYCSDERHYQHGDPIKQLAGCPARRRV